MVSNSPALASELEGQEYNIAELVSETGIPVKTIRYYQNYGLLLRPRRTGRNAVYSSVHIRQLRRIRELQEKGWSLRAISSELENHELPTPRPPVERATEALRGDLSKEDLARLTHIPTPILTALIQQGILRSQLSDRDSFTHTDVRLGELGLELLAQGIPLPEILGVASRVATMMNEISRDAVDLFDDHVRSRVIDPDSTKAAAEVVSKFDKLFALTVELAALYFEKTLATSALARLKDRGTPEERDLVRSRLSALQEVSGAVQAL